MAVTVPVPGCANSFKAKSGNGRLVALDAFLTRATPYGRDFFLMVKSFLLRRGELVRGIRSPASPKALVKTDATSEYQYQLLACSD